MDTRWLDKLIVLLEYADRGTRAADKAAHGAKAAAKHVQGPWQRLAEWWRDRRRARIQHRRVKLRLPKLGKALRLVDSLNANVEAKSRRDETVPPEGRAMPANVQKLWSRVSDWMRENWSPALDDDLYWACYPRREMKQRGPEKTPIQKLFLDPQTWDEFCAAWDLDSLGRESTIFHNNAKRLIGAYRRFLRGE